MVHDGIHRIEVLDGQNQKVTLFEVDMKGYCLPDKKNDSSGGNIRSVRMLNTRLRERWFNQGTWYMHSTSRPTTAKLTHILKQDTACE